MAPRDTNKTTESVLDDQEIPDREEQQEQEQEQPKDVRSAIRAAFDEHREDDELNIPRDKDTPKQRRTKSDNDSVEDVLPDKKDGNKDRKITREKEESSEEQVSSKESKKEEVKFDPPPFYKNKGKTTWDKLSPEDKQTIITREKEVSDGFAQVSQRIKNVEDIERVIAPRLQTIQRYGVPPAQIVDRLFQWMENLQNPQTAAKSFKDLAEGLGVNLNQLVGQTNANAKTEDQTADSPPSWFSEFTGVVDQRLSRAEQAAQASSEQLAAQRRMSAENAVANWAKDKSHYQQVAPLMGQLLQSGIVGLKEDGSVDLDGAYEKAIKLDPNVAALIQQEAAEKVSKEAEEKATKEAKEKADKLARAKRAGAGLKPAAPSGPVASNSKVLNGAKKDTSVRGSIRAAMEELRE